MTVMCIGYYDKFSRFFLDIKKHLQIQHNSFINFKVYSIHFSGFLYTLFRLNFSCWLPLKAWFLVQRKKRFYKTVINSSDVYKEISYKDYIKFHEVLNSNIPKQTLQLQAIAYIDIFKARFKKHQPDYLLTIGDSRLSIEIAIALAKKNNIKIYYIEQGPFNTTFFDNEGVNANLSIRKKYNSEVFDSLVNTETQPYTISKKYKRLPLYRGMDFLFAKLFEKTSIYPPDLKYTDIAHYNASKAYNASNKNIKHFKKPFALLVLQVPKDVNMIYHSPNFKTHTQIVANVYSNLPEGIQLIVREHPLYIGKYRTPLYDFIKENNIPIDNNTSLNQVIETAKIVIVNNSTVGIEAILKYKTTVVLGNSFYDNNHICLKLKSKEELAAILKKAMNYEPDKAKINTFKKVLFNRTLFQGAITDKTLISSKSIAHHILANQ
ncbi:hypothetical protein FBALC1_04842 [Flavobacteriales bacterium ALC-1]|nr:hypothetical protein FBALC1_04842 [Flavobacteriales bacterium ALC-1]